MSEIKKYLNRNVKNIDENLKACYNVKVKYDVIF